MKLCVQIQTQYQTCDLIWKSFH